MALLGLDLLRMHNNKAVFADYKQHCAGFFDILGDVKLPAAAGSDGSSSGGVGSGNASSASSSQHSVVAAACSSTARLETDAARKPSDELDYPELHSLSVEDQHSSAAIVATLLLVRWMRANSEGELLAATCDSVQEKVSMS